MSDREAADRMAREKRMPARSISQMAVLAACSFCLYAWNIGGAPVTPREHPLLESGRALAANQWRDASGVRFPLFVEASEDTFLAPIAVYGEAVIARFLSSDTARLRLLAVVFGVANVLLVYALAFELFGSTIVALAAAAVLLFDPAHVLLSRQASVDGVWAVPFVLSWLIGVARYLRNRSRTVLCAATASLAVAVYSQPSAPLTVFLMALAGLAAFRFATGFATRDLLTAAGAGLALLVPLAVWFAAHPSTYMDTFGRWLLHPAHIRNPVALAQAVSNWFSLTVWIDLYWDFFSPAHLFANAGAPGLVGVFLTPVCVLIGLGLLAGPSPATSQASDQARRIVLICALLLPLVPAAFKEQRAFGRALAFAPIGALFAARGIQAWWSRGSARSRALVVVLLVIAGLQFSIFYRHLV